MTRTSVLAPTATNVCVAGVQVEATGVPKVNHPASGPEGAAIFVTIESGDVVRKRPLALLVVNNTSGSALSGSVTDPRARYELKGPPSEAGSTSVKTMRTSSNVSEVSSAVNTTPLSNAQAAKPVSDRPAVGEKY